MENWILRFTLVDQIDQPILVQISQKAGGHLLDLDLLATDGDNAYRGKIRHSKLQKYRSSSYDGSDQEWLNLLQYVLLLKSDADLPTGIRNNLECVCYVEAGERKSTLSIILRTRVEDITHKLGTIDLKHSENTDDIDLFAWTNQVVQSRDALSAEVKQNEQNVQKGTDIIKTLERQLQELSQAKEDHETQLLTKFTLLLNEKKLRIRAQQRQLVEQGQPTKRTGSESRTTSKRKRKEIEESIDNENNSQESEGFQAMEVDRLMNAPSETDPAETPSTASGLGDGSDSVPEPADRKEESSRLPSATPPPRNLPFPLQSESIKQERSHMKVDFSNNQHPDIKKDDDETTSDDDDEL